MTGHNTGCLVLENYPKDLVGLKEKFYTGIDQLGYGLNNLILRCHTKEVNGGKSAYLVLTDYLY